MTPLPIDPLLPRVVELLRDNPCLVLTSPPGSGKTTRVPAALLAAGIPAGEHPALIMLQPRRVAARAAAQRIAEERGWRIGREIGWHIRRDNRTGPATRLRILTEGILTRRLEADPYLEGIGAVVLDEFHERHLHTDLAIARLRELQTTVRPDLRLVVMSATLAAEAVAAYLGHCPVLHGQGRTFPVTITHLDRDDARPLHERALAAVREVLNTGPARQPSHAADTPRDDVLVFLPGVGEIRRLADALADDAPRAGAVVRPLYAALPPSEQDAALAADPAGRRKIVLATNVAETSLTIEGIGTVIDTGTARVLRHDAIRGLDHLELTRISRASADQRAGRAGRTGPGRCLRLWTVADHRQRPEQETPEVARVDLCEAILTVSAWGYRRAEEFGWLTPPSAEQIAGAQRLLRLLGAVEATGDITPLGRQLLNYPLPPRLARVMVAASDWGCRRLGAELAAVLAEPDALRDRWPRGGPRPGERTTPREASVTGRSDLLMRRDALRRGDWDPATTGIVNDRIAELLDLAERADTPAADKPLGLRNPTPPDDGDDLWLKLTLLAYPDRLCRRRPLSTGTAPSHAGVSNRAVMVGGRGVVLDAASVVTSAELFVAIDPTEHTHQGRLELRVSMASEVAPHWLSELLADHLTHHTTAEFDADRGTVVGVSQRCWADLVLREDRSAPVTAQQAAAVLAAVIADNPQAVLAANPAATAWLDRIAWLASVMPEYNWPNLDGPTLAAWLADACWGCRSLAEVAARPLVAMMAGQLTATQRAALDREAPPTLTVPTGNRLTVRYQAGQAPRLSVRLQELFGLAQTPRLAGGRVAVVIELLAPNYRPVQVTSDLASFWNTTYQQVRRDLRARYPKHAWPEDPWTAPPVAKGRSAR